MERWIELIFHNIDATLKISLIFGYSFKITNRNTERLLFHNTFSKKNIQCFGLLRIFLHVYGKHKYVKITIIIDWINVSVNNVIASCFSFNRLELNFSFCRSLFKIFIDASCYSPSSS